VGAMLPQNGRLIRRWCQQVEGHNSILLSTIPEGGSGASFPASNAGVSAPQL
jgi:hypothetical protein